MFFSNTGALRFENRFTLSFCGQELFLAKVVNLVHESMFQNLWLMMLQKRPLSEPMVS